ncbi:hypothetical protein [Mangrovimonas sp. YM274]|uniref:hypothetical protein n=1 Tax=Mangrovimonas sp. YM274 TaxID=3070660 RepID=UPI0027DDEA2C|nr:hypothetical protein [Mangrovimonas sp. YM274]WMI70075.1 hypothetical protein RBH95_06925 [Mangrovimonas sp. YM274]
MNYKKEPYPKCLKQLLLEAHELAIELKDKLSHDSTPILKDLYRVANDKVWRQTNLFEELGYFPNNVSGKSGSENEFKGIYVFGEQQGDKVVPVYVGISRTIFRRLRQHGWGKLHNECTLAYLLSNHEDPNITRASVTNEFLNTSKEQLRNYKVVLHPVEEDYNLYFLEVALAGIFKAKWNSFRTH